MTCALTGKSRSFDAGLARAVGINAAIVFHYIHYWIGQNRMNPRAWQEGKPWMYQTVAALAEALEILSQKEVRNAVDKLIEAGYLVKGKFSRHAFDRTTWYRIGENGFHTQAEQIAWETVPKNVCRGDDDDSRKSYDVSKRKYDMPLGANAEPSQANAIAQGGGPIEIDKRDREKEKLSLLSDVCDVDETESNFLTGEFFEHLTRHHPGMKLPDRRRSQEAIDRMIRLDKRVPADVRKVISFLGQDDFWCSVVLSGEKLRKNFDALVARIEQAKKSDAVTQNRLLANEAKRCGAPLIVEGRWVRHATKPGKDLSMEMNHEAFAVALRAMVHG